MANHALGHLSMRLFSRQKEPFSLFASKRKCQEKEANDPLPSPHQKGSTNMPLFSRVYKCKEYESLEWKESVNNEWNEVNSTEEPRRPPIGTLVWHELADSSLAAAVAMAPFDSGFDPRQRRHLIRAHLVSQLICVQLVLLDWGSNQQNL